MNYTKETGLLTASGRFNFYDSLEQTRLLGNEGVYHLDKREFTLSGNPKFLRYDTASAETLVITGIQMSYLDSLKRATVSQNVNISKGKLNSICKFAHFFTKDNFAQLREAPIVKYEANTVNGDSIDLKFGKEALKNAIVMGKSHGLYVDTTSPKGDSALTHIWGDSLIMTVNDSGVLDSLWAFGKALSKNYATSDPNAVNEASGKKMMLSFAKDGNVDRVKIWGNARSIYFIEERDSRGRNEATGDSIAVSFLNGKAKKLSLWGAARGIYFPELSQVIKSAK